MKKPTEKLARIGLIANPEKPSCRQAITRVVQFIKDRGAEALYDAGAAAFAPGPASAEIFETKALAAQADMLLVFGGDGTMLRAAREAADGTAPLLGINTGRLGFLTAVSVKNLDKALVKIWAGEFSLESRPLIEASVLPARSKETMLALNDFVIGRGDVSRAIELEVTVDGELLTQYLGDGLIVSSPTGSTAYSLAAGGAIVSPQARVFALTPICPHALSNRTVIVSLDSVVRVSILSRKLATILSADGQTQETLSPRDRVEIRHGKRCVRLVRLEGSSFFATLRRKLDWRGTSV